MRVVGRLVHATPRRGDRSSIYREGKGMHEIVRAVFLEDPSSAVWDDREILIRAPIETSRNITDSTL